MNRTDDWRNEKAKRNGLNLNRWRGPRGLRAQALRRDHHLCQHPGCTNKATTVHIRPELNGDHRRATLNDCTSLCHTCHGRIDGRRSQTGGTSRARRTAAIPDGAQIPPRAENIRRSRSW